MVGSLVNSCVNRVVNDKLSATFQALQSPQKYNDSSNESFTMFFVRLYISKQRESIDRRNGARVEYHRIVNSSYRMVDASTLIFHTVEPSRPSSAA